MPRVCILYRKYLTADGSNMTIGGIQTYIHALSELISDMGLDVYVFQYANSTFEKRINNTTVIGVDVKGIRNEKRKKKKILAKSMVGFNVNEDVLLFACESMVVSSVAKKSIAVQHGISWDVREHEHFSNLLNNLYLFKKAIKAFLLIERIQKVKKLICVDHNFVNWYRTQVAHDKSSFHVIPNYTKIMEPKKQDQDTVRIIFARRFVERRGTRLFAEAVYPILQMHGNVYVTIAGEGPDQKWLENKFKNEERVNFIKYEYFESLKIHSEHDIAVVPTIGSEGTSLSLLEAMASSCAVIATNVGGITNVLLDNFNGLLVNPEEKQLRQALEKLVINKKLREKLSANAYHTVLESFNFDLWKDRWRKVLYETLKVDESYQIS